MTKEEQRLFEANKRLVDERSLMLADINMLISYILGNNEIKDQVKDIILYYEKKRIPKEEYKRKGVTF